jgi:methyltransferase (TIGR00027 family)
MKNDVAATARITASIRARETARPAGLFRDPLAEVLAGHEAMAAMQAMPEAVRDRSSMYTVIRTRVFDDWLLTTLGPGRGVAQVVLLGAGFDSRAFRLDWPPGVRLWELDQVSLLAAKEAILARVAAIPGCQRTSLAVDFADADWPGELKSAGLRSEVPTAWLAEGLLPYLAPDVAVGMLDAVRELSSPGSHFAMDVVDEVSISTRNQYLAGLRQLSPSLKGASFQFGTDDPRQLLADHGWTTTRIMHPGDRGANFGRFTTFPGMPGLPLPLLSFVLARRA